MRIPLTEPTAPRYIFINPKTNIVHIMMPIVSGSEIGLDNTCASVVVLKEFFGQKSEKNSLLNELHSYQEALELDIALIGKDCPLRQLKENRLRQIKTYIKLIEQVQKSSELDVLKVNFPFYPAPLQKLIASEKSNLYSMHLKPENMDSYLRTRDPVFSIQRKNPSIFIEQMVQAFQDIPPGVSQKEKIITLVLETAAAKLIDFEGIRRELRRIVSEELGIDVTFTHNKVGSELTQKMIREAYDAETAREYIEAFLGFCAPNLFDTVKESPFDTTQTSDQLSLVTQFFLAYVNIYCRAMQISSANFGEKLDASKGLSQQVAKTVKDARVSKCSIEDALLDFVSDHSQYFGLIRIVHPADRAKIKDKFSQYYAQIKESPQLDEFLVLDNSKSGPFVFHQGAICLNFIDFVRQGWSELECDFVRADFKGIQNSIRHDNPCVHATVELSPDEFAGFIENKTQLNILIKKLPHSEQKQMLALPMIQEKLQVANFLDYVAKGKQNEAEQILQQFPDANIVLQVGTFTDYSGRTFTCTAYEYAYWAKDIHMCRMIAKFLDENAKKEVLQRCQAIEHSGLAYRQNEKNYCSLHFDFTPLITALEQCAQAYADVTAGAHNVSVYAAWVEVGKAQRDLPAHVVHEYCREGRTFTITPTFLDPELPRTLRLFNWNSTVVDEDWFPLATNEDLGVEKGYYKGLSDNPTPGGCQEDASLDLAAMRALDRIRSSQLCDLIRSLQPQLATQVPFR